MKHRVTIDPFAERHFIKIFARKYKGAWDRTLKALVIEYTYIEKLFGRSIVETIIDSEDIKICKAEFKIIGTDQSRHGSGNRSILAIHKKTFEVYVLLVYHKTDLGSKNETAEWQKIIRENYQQYKNVL